MFQAAAAFSGGILLKQKLDSVQLPQLRRVVDTARTFTLSVRVLAASVPGLDAPGILSHQRPFIEGSLGSSRKETEFADFAARGGGPYAEECPWRFGDTLTFKARLEDVVGAGLHLSLRVRKDIVLGPVQFEMRAAEVGVGCMHLQQRVLPACVQERRQADGGGWESPVMLVPLVRSNEGQHVLAEGRLGEAVAHVALAFSMDTDPETILASLTAPSLAKRLEEGVDGVMSWLNKKVDDASSTLDVGSCEGAAGLFAKCRMEPGDSGPPYKIHTVRSPGRSPASSSGPSGGGDLSQDASLSGGPDLSADGWVCHRKPNGRVFWHHTSLGPAPWTLLDPDGAGGGGSSSSSSARPAEAEARRRRPSEPPPQRGAYPVDASAARRLPRGQPVSQVFGEEGGPLFDGGTTASRRASSVHGVRPQPRPHAGAYPGAQAPAAPAQYYAAAPQRLAYPHPGGAVHAHPGGAVHASPRYVAGDAWRPAAPAGHCRPPGYIAAYPPGA